MPTTVATGMRRFRMHGTPPIWLGFTVMRENLIFRPPLYDEASEELSLSRADPVLFGPSQLRELGPGDDKAIIREGLLGPLLPFADRVEPISQVACRLAHTAELVE